MYAAETWGDLRAYIMAAVNVGDNVDVEKEGHSVKVHDFAWHRRYRPSCPPTTLGGWFSSSRIPTEGAFAPSQARRVAPARGA
jgi:hypothetical protein